MTQSTEALLTEGMFIGGPRDGQTVFLPSDYPYERYDFVEVAPAAQFTEDTVPFIRHVYRIKSARKEGHIHLIYEAR